MIKHTFFSKCNTIIKDSEYNTGLNPVAELNAGSVTSRVLIYINLDDLKQAVANGEMNIENLTHVLKMKNCGSVNLPIFNEQKENNCTTKTRAASFDVIVFKLTHEWDEGRGFDYFGDYAKDTYKIASKDGSNWYQANNGLDWNEEGVYSLETLTSEYKKYGLEKSVVIGKQHFDSGIEDFEIDITNYINDVISNNLPEEESYYGLGLAFNPRFEQGSGYYQIAAPIVTDEVITAAVTEIPKYKIPRVHYIIYNDQYYKWYDIREEDKFISFFTNHTNTFFHPYLETTNNEIVLDDRAKFHLGTTNRLYFFAYGDEGPFNLDFIPTCTIDGIEYPVKQGGKGIYYAEITLHNGIVEPDTILIDKWSNIVINGLNIDDVEMEFVVLPFERKISLGKHTSDEDYALVPQISGVCDKEKIKIGDAREIKVDFIKEYSYGEKHIPSSAWYRVYVKEGNREIDVYPYHPIERHYDEHFLYIDSLELIPNDYHIDIMVNQNGKAKYFENCLEFTIVDNVTNFYV